VRAGFTASRETEGREEKGGEDSHSTSTRSKRTVSLSPPALIARSSTQ
jgi:hypothetical protein